MTQDFKRQLMHNRTREYQALGLSFTTANGMAMHKIESDAGNGGYDWRSVWPPSANDERILRMMEMETAA
jgi:hypothetical protein